MKANTIHPSKFWLPVGSMLILFGMLTPSPIRAQSYYLQYNILVGDIQHGTQNNTYNTGAVQSTNRLTANLGASGSICSATATPVATFGQLQLTANASTDLPISNGNGYGSRYGSGTGGGQDVVFYDTLTVTSSTLARGTPVTIVVSCIYSGDVQYGASFTDGTDGSSGEASASIQASDVVGETGSVGPINQTNILSTIIPTQVGSSFKVYGSLEADGYADNGDAHAFDGFSAASITSQTYVTPLTSGVGYTTASGATYPAQLPPPILTIAPGGNQTVLLSWPSAYLNYVLQQSQTLNPSSWIENSNTISVLSGGTNQVSVSVNTNAMYFRLMEQ
jgi:hypothetical protein